MNEPLLSICIPTNGISKWILPTLEAIYSQNVDISLYEVVITDNGADSTLSQDLELYKYDNLHYVRTNDSGFLNLVTSLECGNGTLRKMLNHRSVIIPGTIERWLSFAEKYKKTKPVLFFSDFRLKKGGCIECENIDSFIESLSYWSSWSAGLSIWDIDVDRIKTIKLNEMFPNTSLLLNMRETTEYVICDDKYQEMQDETGKGGYDLFHTFAVTYLDILSELRIHKRVSERTFISVKKDLKGFLLMWFRTLLHDKDKYTFVNSDIKQSFLVYYSEKDYYYINALAYLLLPFDLLIIKVKKLIKKMFS